MPLHSEFREFLRKHNIVALAIGFIMGLASNDLIKSFVDNMLMPIIIPLTVAGGFEEAQVTLGGITLKHGLFISAFIKFLLLALVVFIFSKIVIREKKEEQKEAVAEEQIGEKKVKKHDKTSKEKK